MNIDEELTIRKLASDFYYDVWRKFESLGWDLAANGKYETKYLIIEAGSTGIHKGYRDNEGNYWVCDEEMCPSCPTFIKEIKE